MQGLTINAPSYVKNPKGSGLGFRNGCPVQACRRALVRRFPGRIRPPVPATGGRRHLQRLNPAKRPNSFLACSDPSDVARVEDRTYICSRRRKTLAHQQLDGPGRDARHAAAAVRRLHEGPHHVRGAIQHGPLGSHIAHIGVELTDSAYVAVNQRLMTRMGKAVYDVLGVAGEFVPCMHTVGAPLGAGEKTAPAGPATPGQVHRPTPRRAKSGPTVPATAATPAGQKCLALRIASTMGRDQGWLAEHMLILGVTNPRARSTTWPPPFPAPAARPTSPCWCRPEAAFKGWKVTTIGDDIAWIKPHADGKMYAINPEAGYFGVAPAPTCTPTPTACCPEQGRDLHQRGPDRRRRRGGKAWRRTPAWCPTT